jgi:uncharacterized phage-associated protein
MKIKFVTNPMPMRIKCRLVVEACPMMLAHDVAKYFVSLVDEEAGDSITNLKLQKLLYYAQGVNLALNDAPLFAEEIEAWTHGPVVPKEYHRYKQHGGEAIPVERVNLDVYPKELRELLDEVNEVFGQFSAAKLRAMTHNEPPWKDTPPGAVISTESMKAYFKTVVTRDDGPSEARTN